MTNKTYHIAFAAVLALSPTLVAAQSENEAPKDEATIAAEAAVESSNIIKAATGAVARLGERDKFASLAANAKAIVIFPDVIKAGFLISGQAGTGLLMTKRADGGWSAPAFYSMASAGFGLQAGMELSTIGLIVMSDEALNSFYDGGLDLSGGVDVTLATMGGTADIDTTADIISFTAAKGAFAGVSLKGSNFSAERGRNAAYYGAEMTTKEVVENASLTTPEIEALHAAMVAL